MADQPNPYQCAYCGTIYVVRVLAADCMARHAREAKETKP